MLTQKLTRKTLRRQRESLDRRLAHLTTRIAGRDHGDVSYDVAEIAALKTALDMFDKAIVAIEEEYAWQRTK